MIFRLILSTKSDLTWKPNTEWARGLPPHKGPTGQHENHELDHLRSLSPYKSGFHVLCPWKPYWSLRPPPCQARPLSWTDWADLSLAPNTQVIALTRKPKSRGWTTVCGGKWHIYLVLNGHWGSSRINAVTTGKHDCQQQHSLFLKQHPSLTGCICIFKRNLIDQSGSS